MYINQTAAAAPAAQSHGQSRPIRRSQTSNAPFSFWPDAGGSRAREAQRPPGLGRRPVKGRAPSSSARVAFGWGSPAPAQTAGGCAGPAPQAGGGASP